jgi:hypothetical protein
MNLKEEVLNMKQEVQEVKEQSFAMEIYKDSVKDKKRFFFMWIVTFIAFIGLLGYTIWLLNDIGTNEDTIDIQDVETIDNSHIKIGDDTWEKSE